MNILIVTSMFPPIKTGTSFYSRNLANTFATRGHNVKVITVNNKDYEKEPDVNNLIDIYRIPALHFPLKNYFKHLRICSFIPQNYFKVNTIIKSFQPDVLLLINHYLDISFPAIYAARKNKVPLYISVGTQLQSLNPIRNKILNILDKLIVGNLIFPFTNNIISWDKEIHRYIEDVHTKRNSKKSIIIPFGVNGDIDVFYDHKHDYNQDKQILGVGSIIGHRNYLFQIRVFKELLKYHPNLHLKIIGHRYIDSPVGLAKELGIENKVEFTGELPHDEVLNEYKRSAIHWMMLAGEYSGLGTSTIEAMLMGLPVVSNVPENLFGTNDLVDMKSFVYTDGVSVEIIVKNLLILLNEPALRKKIGNKGQEFVKNNMNWDIIAEKYEALFNHKQE